MKMPHNIEAGLYWIENLLLSQPYPEVTLSDKDRRLISYSSIIDILFNRELSTFNSILWYPKK